MTRGARRCERLAARELSALPRGIGDVHGAISGRVFGALGPAAAPVRVMHDTISRGVYASVSGGLRRDARSRRVPRRRELLRDAARRDGARRAERAVRRQARAQPAGDPDGGAPRRRARHAARRGLPPRPRRDRVRVGLAELRRAAARGPRDHAGVRPLQHRPPHLPERRVARGAARRAGRGLAGRGRADHADRALDGRARRAQRLPPRRRLDHRSCATPSRSARRTRARRSSRPCTR